MKLIIHVLNFMVWMATPIMAGVPEAVPEWTLTEQVYGQFRLVPSEVVPHKTKVVEWNGPWGTYRTFSLKITHSDAHQTFPGNFHLVHPVIGLNGTKDRTSESSSTGVRLFDRASVPSEINVEFQPAPEEISLDQEYKAATVTGEDALASWEVFVRFTKEKPEYIREK